MRILLVGASGFIGSHLADRLSRFPVADVHCTFRSNPRRADADNWRRLDLGDPGRLDDIFSLINPDVVVHLAAIADVGRAEREPEAAAAVNVGGAASVAERCVKFGARMIYVSTEYVFSGTRGYYNEADQPNPVTQYGRTKLDAELAVARICNDWCLVRTSIVYGWPAPGKRNFAPWLIETLRRDEPYHAPTDVFRTPVYVAHLAEGIGELVMGNHQGIYHLAGRDWVSMYDFASAIAGEFRLNTDLVIPAGPVPFDPRRAGRRSGRAAGRPDLLGLDCSRSVSALGLQYRGLAEGIAALAHDAPQP